MYYDFSIYKYSLVAIMPREVTVKPNSDDENLYTIHPTSILFLHLFYIYIVSTVPTGV